MKKMLSIMLALLLLTGVLCGCTAGEPGGGLKVVCTVFPVYDWMRELTAGSEDIELILVADNGVDMHSYQPTTGDIVDISTCDMLVRIGGQSEEWVSEVVERSGNDRMLTADLLDMLGERALCAAPHDHGDDHGHAEHHHHDAKDEHIWLSAVNARLLCLQLTDMLCELDEENQQLYRDNCEKYAGQLDQLDQQYRQAAEDAAAGELVFADRFPFRYLTEDYSLAYCAAFDGCEAETEASFETVTRLAAELNEQQLDWVIIIEGSEDRLAHTIIGASDRSGCGVLTLDSMQSVTAEEITGGVSYLSVMESNLEVLRQALGC